MKQARGWDDQRIEVVIAYLLRAGVTLAALLVIAGGILYLLNHGREVPAYHTFKSEPETLRAVSKLLDASSLQHGSGLIQLGLVVLILTPIARVAFAMLAFTMEHDWTFFTISGIVLGLLIYSFTSA